VTLLALDGGQSGCRARIDDGDAIDLPAVHTHRSVVDQLAALVRTAAPDGADVVCIGTTGLGSGDTAAALLALLPDVGEVRLAHDSVTSYLGGLGDRPGCVVAAGTGSIIFAVGETAVARVDGWGHIIGDAGSGYWIGRAALDAVLRAYDGRGFDTTLSAVVTADFPDLEQLYLDLQADPDRVRRVASYAKAVADHAHTDAVAASIAMRAADELAASVDTALRRVGAPPDAPVCRLGNVFKGQVLARRFADELFTLRPDAQIVQAKGTGLDGAALMATASGGLLSRIDIARSAF
jgi:N-acetylglucosamine kinase-like BadF-type ATPase